MAAVRVYEEFANEFLLCWHCGWALNTQSPTWHFAKLDNAHILGGAARTADRRNLCRLCEGCHRLAHGARVRRGGKYLATIGISEMLWLKKYWDLKYYDREYLNDLRIRRLPLARKPKQFLSNDLI